MKKEILIVDDCRLFREGLRKMIEKRPDLKVIAEAADGRGAVNLARKLRPHLIIIDVILPGLNGVEATLQITSELPDVKVLGVSGVSDEKQVARMLQAGAAGYLVKNCSFRDLMTAIVDVLEGKLYLSPGLTGNLIKDLIGSPPAAGSTRTPTLTTREREVLQLVSEGESTKNIAELLFVSAKTVETHRKHIMDKLNIHTVAELTKYAIREGMTSSEN